MRTFVKIIVAGLVFWGKVMLISAQQVNYCEYYIDNDPGLGQGTAFSFSADTLIEISSQINVSAFSVGHHRLVLRCRDDSGRWSQHQTRVFNIYFPESSVNQLVEAEYWTGADPGQGNGSSLPISADSVVILQPNLTPAPGTQQLSIRFRGNNGIWSQPYTRAYSAITPEPVASQLPLLEYYYDDELTSKQFVSVSTGSTVDTSLSLSVTLPATGSHRLNVALRDDLGKSSLTGVRWFNTIQAEPVDSMVQFAVYVDDTIHMDGPTSTLGIVKALVFNDTLKLNLNQPAKDYEIYVAGISQSGKYGFPSKIKDFTTCDVLPQADFAIDSTVYVNLPFKVRNTTQNGDTTTTYVWSYKEGSNELSSSKFEPIFVFGSLGNYDIQLVARNIGKCADTITHTVATNEVSGCLGDFVYENDNGRTFNFYNVSVASTGTRWDFGDGTLSDVRNTSHTFKADGQYRVCMTNFESSTKCLKRVCKDIVVGPVKCKSVFGYTVDTNNSNTLHFTDQSQDMEEYLWDFGDGWTSKQQHPSHTYSEAGTYRVCHAIKSASLGCYEQSCQEITVGNPTSSPFNAYFVYYVDHASKKVYLSNNSSPEANSYYWTFGDGSYVSTEDAEHQYATNGAYEVCLQVANSSTKQSDRYCETVLVGDTLCKIAANFNAFVDTANRVIFVNQSKGTNLQYFWNFGDGTTSTAFQPEHTYAQSGKYLVSLSVGNASCFDYTSAYIEVGIVPCSASFAYQYQPGTGEMSFYNQSTGNNNAYFWNFGDGNYSFDANPTHTYAQQGSYRVSLTVTNTVSGCQDIQTQQVQVGDANCKALFSFFVDSATYSVRFNNRSTGSYNNLLWSFGDGKFSTQANPTHRFVAPGYYKVGITIMNTSNGCSDYYEETLLVGNSLNDCEADFSYVPQSGSRTVKFFDQSQGNIIGHLWNFGDGTYESDQHPTHTFNTSGYKNVCLLVVNQNYQTHIKCKPVVVNPENKLLCRADFSYVVDSLTREVIFTDKSYGMHDTWQWNFGDGQTDNTQHPSHTYSKAGYYLVGLTVTNVAEACTSKTYKLINVASVGKLKAGFAYERQQYNKKAGGYPVDFIGAGLGDEARLKWTFGDSINGVPSIDTTTNTPTHVYQQEGKYYVCYEVSDPVTHQKDSVCQWVQTSPTVVTTTASLTNQVSVYPNPFDGVLNIRYRLESAAVVEITIYDLYGKLITTLVRSYRDAGQYSITWDGSNLPKGTYVVRTRYKQQIISQNLIVRQ